MGYTNKTTHYELPQYVATDKPKYLTDFNETMVAIDTQMYNNAQAAATADGKAVAAKEVADGAVSSIGTLNTQINGDPQDPTDTGLTGQISDNSTDIETVQSLIGNGTPTTSNQTIIGAINGLEGAIAPREDGADLANSYATGAQFARGGSIYEALTDLTAGTAFASLTLNTDYKVADTLVEQIADTVTIIENKVGAIVEEHGVTLTAEADGVKTYSQLLEALRDAFIAYCQTLSNDEFAKPTAISDATLGIFTIVNLTARFTNAIVAGTYLGTFFFTRSTATYVQLGEVNLGTPSGMRTNTWTIGSSTDWTLDELSNTVAANNLLLIVNKYKYNS